jgi:Family of unknown function (DUF6178)
MNLPSVIPVPLPLLKTSQIYRRVFESTSPEVTVQELPSELLYLAIIDRGIVSASELIEIIPVEKLRVVLDLDLWRNGEFNEDAFWEWMRVTDSTDDLQLLHRIVGAFDLKIMSLIFGRYVVSMVFDEPADEPPGPDFYTPDKGLTWIQVSAPDNDTHFLLSRLLALIYEGAPNLFYQLLSLPSAWTLAMIEEEAVIDRNRRLIDEGIPDREHAEQLHKPLSLNELKSSLSTRSRLVSESSSPHRLAVIEPFLGDTPLPSPLRICLLSPALREDFLPGFTLLCNAATVFFGIHIGNTSALTLLLEGVKSTLGLAFEDLSEKLALSREDLFIELGITSLYRYGLSLMFALRRDAHRIRQEQCSALEREHRADWLFLQGLRRPLPLAVEEGENSSVEFRGISGIVEYRDICSRLAHIACAL